MKASSEPSIQYRLPAEWEPQEAVWLTWPQNIHTWQDLLPEVEDTYYKICDALLRHIDVYLAGDSSGLLKTVEEKLGDKHPYKLHTVVSRTNDCWIRDYGGVTVFDKDGRRRMLNWKFNSWGGKYAPWEDDNQFPIVMAKTHEFAATDMELVLEAGAIDVNGQGLMLAAYQSFLHENRNPGYTKEQVAEILHQYLGAEDVIWLQGGIAGDDTDGHVDNLARFVSGKTVFCAIEENISHGNYQVLKANIRELERHLEKVGLDIVEIPMPDDVVVKGLTTPASYLNFLITNGAVLVPVFSCRQDDRVLALFEKCFPERRIYPIESRLLSYGQGGVHCITMQAPQSPIQ